MKNIFASILVTTSLLSGCTTIVMTEVVEPRPVTIVNTTYVQPYCRWVDVPVYGYADVYRDGYNRVRIKEVAYVDRQWRCH
jgi:GTP-binding protein EngB required for normal cell division